MTHLSLPAARTRSATSPGAGRQARRLAARTGLALALLALPARASGGAGTPALAPDTVVPVRVARVEAAAGERVLVPVTVDLTAAGKALGSYQGKVLFDPGQLRLVSATAGGFDGPAVVNADHASKGTVIFAGASPDARRNRARTRILELTFEVTAAPGSRAAVRLELQELVAAGDFSDLTPLASVEDGEVVVRPEGGR